MHISSCILVVACDPKSNTQPSPANRKTSNAALQFIFNATITLFANQPLDLFFIYYSTSGSIELWLWLLIYLSIINTAKREQIISEVRQCYHSSLNSLSNKANLSWFSIPLECLMIMWREMYSEQDPNMEQLSTVWCWKTSSTNLFLLITSLSPFLKKIKILTTMK